jgi:hypothetical protein
MPKRSRKEQEDINKLAKSIVEEATKESYTEEPTKEKPEKNPAAVALGRLGVSRAVKHVPKSYPRKDGKKSLGKRLRLGGENAKVLSFLVPCCIYLSACSKLQ